MTKQEAIENHRKMWNWIADQIEERKEIVSKSDYFNEIGMPVKERPLADCFCCEYAKTKKGILNCNFCPVKWLDEVKTKKVQCYCMKKPNPYWEYQKLIDDRDVDDMSPNKEFDYKRMVGIARQIANLPEREEKEYKVVTICGSNKFRTEQMVVYRELTSMNCLVFLPDYDARLNGMSEIKIRNLHFKKIKMSDAICVVTNGGYWGSSTQEEIDYAKSLGKDIIIRDFKTSTVGTFKQIDEE